MTNSDNSELTIIKKKQDDRSEFEKDFEDDTLFQLQNRMLAKAKTKKFTVEEFVEKAQNDLQDEEQIVSDAGELPETPEPEEEQEGPFFF